MTGFDPDKVDTGPIRGGVQREAFDEPTGGAADRPADDEEGGAADRAGDAG